MSVRNLNRMKSSFTVLIFLVIFLAGGCIYPAVPIQGRNLEGNTAASARTKLLAAAESYLGTPYRYGGADSRGIDCSGLVYASFKDALNIQVPRSSEGLYTWAEKIPTADMRPGDLVFFNTSGSGVSHVGIYAGNGRFIHSPSEGVSTGVMYNRLDESYWQRTFIGGGRALPWDEEAEQVFGNGTPVSAATSAGGSFGISPSRPGATNSEPWAASSGLFAGLGLSSSFGGFIDGSLFRGISFQAKVGYKGLFSDSLQIALEIRPTWDRFLGITRLPVTLAFGTDTFQVFIGPAYTIGEPTIGVDGRAYNSGFSWLGEVGVSLAFPIQVSRGSLSLFTELAWQSYFSNSGQGFNIAADMAANFRISMGLRYINLIKL
ncbi:MAG: C40 family peptidase [Treponema sp.]|jgi:probable lipoprotein NlpC|nr:C40 family peptidase [Treponema sp.]